MSERPAAPVSLFSAAEPPCQPDGNQRQALHVRLQTPADHAVCWVSEPTTRSAHVIAEAHAALT